MLIKPDSIPIHIKDKPTLTKYYGKYLCKVQIRCRFPRLAGICQGNTMESKDVKKKVGAYLKRHGDRPFWQGKPTTSKEQIELLTALNNASLGYNVKSRLEGHTVTLYTETEAELFNILNTYPVIAENAKLMSRPTSAQHEEDLHAGKVGKRTDNGYRFKITFRAGHYDQTVREQIANYVLSLENNIMMSTYALGRLRLEDRNWWSGGAAYTNDESVTLFLRLICPKAILHIKEIVLV